MFTLVDNFVVHVITRTDVPWYDQGGVEIYDAWQNGLAGSVGESIDTVQVLRSILKICMQYLEPKLRGV